MTLAPLLGAPLAVQIHVVAALLAVALAPAQWLLPRGGRAHRLLGRAWALALALAAVSAAFVATEGAGLGPFGPIHLLVPYTLLGIWHGLAAIRRGDVVRHRAQMADLTAFALGVPGAFALLPGRRVQEALLPDREALSLGLAVGIAALAAASRVPWRRIASRRRGGLGIAARPR